MVMKFCKLILLFLVMPKLIVIGVVNDVARNVMFQPYGYRMCILYSHETLSDVRFDYLNLQCDVRETCNDLTKGIDQEKIWGNQNCLVGEQLLDTRTRGRQCVKRTVKSHLCSAKTEIQTLSKASCNSRIRQAAVVFPPPSTSTRTAIKRGNESGSGAPLRFTLADIQHTVSTSPIRIRSDITLWRFSLKIDIQKPGASLAVYFCKSQVGASTTCNLQSTCFVAINNFKGKLIEITSLSGEDVSLFAHRRIAEIKVTFRLRSRRQVVVTFRLGKQVARTKFRCDKQGEVWVLMEGSRIEFIPHV